MKQKDLNEELKKATQELEVAFEEVQPNVDNLKAAIRTKKTKRIAKEYFEDNQIEDSPATPEEVFTEEEQVKGKGPGLRELQNKFKKNIRRQSPQRYNKVPPIQ